MTKSSTKTAARRERRFARMPELTREQAGAAPEPEAKRAVSRLDQIAALLSRPEGATIADMTEATSWQSHSVRGAMAGTLRKRGLTITSDKVDGIRTYRTSQSVAA